MDGLPCLGLYFVCNGSCMFFVFLCSFPLLVLVPKLVWHDKREAEKKQWDGHVMSCPGRRTSVRPSQKRMWRQYWFDCSYGIVWAGETACSVALPCHALPCLALPCHALPQFRVSKPDPEVFFCCDPSCMEYDWNCLSAGPTFAGSYNSTRS